MVEAVLAIDMVDEELSDEAVFNSWFSERGYDVGEEVISKGNEQIVYNLYSKANVFIFKFENTNDYFPEILIDFISSLQNKETQISVAEEGQYGEYNTLVDMYLSDFITYVINGDDEVKE